jgi:HEAT repeat protein
LVSIGPKAEKAVPALIEALKDKDWSVRKAAKEALKKIQKK